MTTDPHASSNSAAEPKPVNPSPVYHYGDHRHATRNRVEQAILEAADRIDNDGRPTLDVLRWLVAELESAT